ncbi:MAG TPA: hypothetical protein VFH90_02325 [Candidatus Limnocylindria bacterium]|nr:hypothetical protein [Candidatus Limnocylindria bacterium]
MPSPPRAAVLLLAVVAGLLAIAGVVGILIGVRFAAWLYSLLPPVLIDVDAVGGAATATGILLLLLAAVHALAAIGLKRRYPRALTPVAVLAASMSLLAIGWAVAALVSAASGSGPPAAMLPAGIGLVLLALAYAWVARWVIGQRQPPS